MSARNSVRLVGRLGQDAQVNHNPDGTRVVNVSMATSEKRKNTSGDYVDHAEWHKIVFWNNLADIIGEYGTKGKEISVEGVLRTRSYENNEGKKVYVTEVIVNDLALLGSKSDA
ncbi:single-stranded DNA-binding protein [Roseivirga pacifica]|uniref:single-stranded DNA-binding protein n=1 Tax=Roseivirga pacifica TaxID=1267423 RepID=UPI00209444EF|nr:single-stranded DNA-binding protein [Roseivirga pacifica]MCO6358194.1 single-stranded DNA-binding protein [Roseivirga pacifica]MCO6366632.1 single-stranded DNA-binding protein [Roseivirga pacifica]MCO6371117.1 single-stranded DNA-binding protein [Roseivirga pacifica]MCO6373925.1 single-stranded DNA-binding protein [Roseivirga pacifica]MCO6380906.1 single-stranded DNA-binding protein [Roseivirga pacifica]